MRGSEDGWPSSIASVGLRDLHSSDRATRRSSLLRLRDDLRSAAPLASSAAALCSSLSCLWSVVLALVMDEAESVRAAALLCLDELAELWDSAAEKADTAAAQPATALQWLLPQLTPRLSAVSGETAEELRLQLLGCIARAVSRDRRARSSAGAAAEATADADGVAEGDELCRALSLSMSDACPAVRLAACDAVAAAWGGSEAQQRLLLSCSASSPLLTALLPPLLLLLRMQRWELRRAGLHSLTALLPLAVLGHAAAAATSATTAADGRPAPPVWLCLPPSLASSCASSFHLLSSDEKPRVRCALLDCIARLLSEPLSSAARRWEGGARWTAEALQATLTPLLAMQGNEGEDGELRGRCEMCVRLHLSVPVFHAVFLPSLCASLVDWTAAIRLRTVRALLACMRTLTDSAQTDRSALDCLLPPLTAALVDDEREVRDTAVHAARVLVAALPLQPARRSHSEQTLQPRGLLPALLQQLLRLQRGGDERRVEGALQLLHLGFTASAARGQEVGPRVSTADAAAALPLSSSSLCRLLRVLHSLELLSQPPRASSTRWQLLRLLSRCVDDVQPDEEEEKAEGSQEFNASSGCEEDEEAGVAARCSPVLLLFLCLHRLDCWLASASERGERVDEEEEAVVRSALLCLSRRMPQGAGEADACQRSAAELPHPAPLYGRFLASLLPQPSSSPFHSAAGPSSSTPLLSLSSSELFLLLRRSADCRALSAATFPAALALLSQAAVASEEQLRASAVSVVAHMLTPAAASSSDQPSPPFAAQLSSAVCEELLLVVLIPACRWSAGSGSQLIRLHGLACIRSLCSLALSAPAAGAAVQRAAHWAVQLLPLLRSNLDDDLGQVRRVTASTLHTLLHGLHQQQPHAATPPASPPRLPLLSGSEWAALLAELLQRLDDADEGVRLSALHALQAALALQPPLAPALSDIDPTSSLARHWALTLALHGSSAAAQHSAAPHAAASSSSSRFLSAVQAALHALALLAPQAVQAALEEAADGSLGSSPLMEQRTQSDAAHSTAPHRTHRTATSALH